MVDQSAQTIFKQSSTTYFISSLFFPQAIKNDVFTLYAFVRVADNYVDAVPQDSQGFYNFVAEYKKSMAGSPSGVAVIDNFVELAQRHSFRPVWIEAFLKAMEADLYKTHYATLKEVRSYMYGSAEVIGLMLARIFQLPERSYLYARRLGRAMQYVNMIRDIAEDTAFGRQYLPTEVLSLYDFSELTEAAATHNKLKFQALVRNEVHRYYRWEMQAMKGANFIPFRLRVPVIAATRMYNWTAQQIAQDPLIVWKKKVKPSKLQVMTTAIALLAMGEDYE